MKVPWNTLNNGLNELCIKYQEFLLFEGDQHLEEYPSYILWVS
jgi:hypothetical protein